MPNHNKATSRCQKVKCSSQVPKTFTHVLCAAKEMENRMKNILIVLLAVLSFPNFAMFINLDPKAKVPDEYTRAFNKFASIVNSGSFLPLLQERTLLIHDSIHWSPTDPALIELTLKARWNQSNGAFTFHQPNGVSLEIKKLNLRWLKKENNNPRIKLWTCLVIKSGIFSHFLAWCELGFQSQTYEIPEYQVSLEELSFLKKHVSLKTAQDLGWIE